MKASTFSEAQIAFVLKQAEGSASVAEVCHSVDARKLCYPATPGTDS